MSNQKSALELWEELAQLDTFQKVSAFSLLIGFFLGVYIKTGVNIKPDDLFINILTEIVRALTQSSSTNAWNYFVLPAFTVVGLFEIYVSLKAIANFGAAGIVASISGFLSGLTLVVFTSTELGQWLFLILAIISFVVSPFIRENDIPRD